MWNPCTNCIKFVKLNTHDFYQQMIPLQFKTAHQYTLNNLFKMSPLQPPLASDRRSQILHCFPLALHHAGLPRCRAPCHVGPWRFGQPLRDQTTWKTSCMHAKTQQKMSMHQGHFIWHEWSECGLHAINWNGCWNVPELFFAWRAQQAMRSPWGYCKTCKACMHHKATRKLSRQPHKSPPVTFTWVADDSKNQSMLLGSVGSIFHFHFVMKLLPFKRHLNHRPDSLRLFINYVIAFKGLLNPRSLSPGKCLAEDFGFTGYGFWLSWDW